MVKQKRPLGRILIKMGVVTPERLKSALISQMEHCEKLLGQILIGMEAATYQQIAEALKTQEYLSKRT